MVALLGEESSMTPVVAAARFVVPPRSPLDGVSPEAWVAYARAMEVQPVWAVSASGGLGAYAMRPQRLVELDVMRDGGLTRRGRRQVRRGELLPAYADFLANPRAQRAVFVRSNLLYDRAMASGDLQRPVLLSRAGALAVLHRGGRGALAGWPDLFSDTRALVEGVEGMF